MKKIIIILCLVALVVTMAVPTFADSPTYYVSGQWAPNDSLTNISWDGVDGITNEYDVNLTLYIGGYPVYINKIGFTPTTLGGSFTIYVYVDGVDEPDQIYPASDTATEQDLIFNFGSAQPVHKNLYDWLHANGKFELCDGSTCPATDVNYDNVCDDCGMPFIYNLRNDTYDYNGVFLPVVPDVFNGRDTYYTLYDGGTSSYTLVASTAPFQQYAADVVINGEAEVIYLAARSGQTEWSQFSSQNATWTNYSIREFSTLVWSSHHVTSVESGAKVFDGDVNFLPPLWEEMEQVTQGALPNLTQTMDGTILTLVLCGVGLMALLVVLALFGKRSLIYRS